MIRASHGCLTSEAFYYECEVLEMEEDSHIRCKTHMRACTLVKRTIMNHQPWLGYPESIASGPYRL
jgi:hypothetical protein